MYRVLKPGGIAFVGRGFPDNLPAEIARKIRSQQRQRKSFPVYDVAATAVRMEGIMKSLGITDYNIKIPSPPGGEDINCGIWLTFHKAAAKSVLVPK
jgi:hypothetical protein